MSRKYGVQPSNADTADAGQDDDSQATSLRNELWAMQYRLIFDNGQPVFTLNQQTEANETNPNLAPGTTAVPGALG